MAQDGDMRRDGESASQAPPVKHASSARGKVGLPDAIIAVIQFLSNNLTLGKITGTAIIGIVLFAVVTASKVSQKGADQIVSGSLGIASRFLDIVTLILSWPSLYGALVSIAFATYYFFSRKRIKALKEEVKRLASVRSELMHGLSSGELKILPDHTSSGLDSNGE